jgi:hypothetical protein
VVDVFLTADVPAIPRAACARAIVLSTLSSRRWSSSRFDEAASAEPLPGSSVDACATVVAASSAVWVRWRACTVSSAVEVARTDALLASTSASMRRHTSAILPRSFTALTSSICESKRDQRLVGRVCTSYNGSLCE